MYWGDELVAIYNEAYIGALYLVQGAYHTDASRRSCRTEASNVNGSKLQGRMG